MNVKLFENSRRDYVERWRAIDEALYDVCRKYPDHTSKAGINAKLWLIGRTFASGIERAIASDGTHGSSLSRLSDFLWENRVRADEIIGSVSRLTEPLTPDGLRQVVVAHGQFVAFIQPLLQKRKKNAHSFASKYLHFHCPRVPIYDSFAKRGATKLVPWRSELKVFELPAEADEEYARYVFRLWHVYLEAKRVAGDSVTVRDVEFFLLYSVGLENEE